MERFFLSLKMKRVWRKNYANQGEALHDIADHIVRFYNNVCLHSSLDNLPPSVTTLRSDSDYCILRAPSPTSSRYA
jgi:hypothetical protein